MMRQIVYYLGYILYLCDAVVGCGREPDGIWMNSLETRLLTHHHLPATCLLYLPPTTYLPPARRTAHRRARHRAPAYRTPHCRLRCAHTPAAAHFYPARGAYCRAAHAAAAAHRRRARHNAAARRCCRDQRRSRILSAASLTNLLTDYEPP